MDDEEDILKLYKITLEKLGCVPGLAHNGSDAVSQYQDSITNGDPIDIVILDLNMPGKMNGIDVAKKIFSLNSAAKIIIASGYPEGVELDADTNWKFSAVIEKTFNRVEIKTILEQALSTD